MTGKDVIETTLVFVRECKHSIRYDNGDADPTELKSIYIPKEGMQRAFGDYPHEIRVVIKRA